MHIVDHGIGRCAKCVVVATITAPDGRTFTSSNHCDAPVDVCPRGDLPHGVGYEMCRDICRQKGHAETNAIALAGEACRGAHLEVTGHRLVCEECFAAATAAGIATVAVS